MLLSLWSARESQSGVVSLADNLLNLQVVSAFVPDREFRVTVEGIKVINQIPDSYSGVGDRGDNVYVNVEILWEDPAGKPQYMHFSRQTLVYGDLFSTIGDLLEPRHKQSAPLQPIIYAGKNGKGLKNGDDVPYSPPWIRKAELTRDRLPMLLDEMKFTTHSGMAYIPSIWSWDEKNELYSCYKNNFGNRIGESSRKIFQVFEDIRDKSVKGIGITKDDFLLESSALGLPVVSVKTDKDGIGILPLSRPVGMVRSDDAYIFNPKVIILDSISAEALASTDQGFGKGVLALEYTDGPEADSAKYVLYLKIERM